MYIEYAARSSGKTLRLSKDVLYHLLKDDRNKVVIFAYNDFRIDLIAENIFINEELMKKIRHQISFYTNEDFSPSLAGNINNILLNHLINEQNVKFYFDDFEELNHLYDLIIQYLNDERLKNRLYLTSSEYPGTRLSNLQLDQLRELRYLINRKKQDQLSDYDLMVLKIKYF